MLNSFVVEILEQRNDHYLHLILLSIFEMHEKDCNSPLILLRTTAWTKRQFSRY